MKHTYYPQGTCSTEICFEVLDGVIQKVEFILEPLSRRKTDKQRVFDVRVNTKAYRFFLCLFS